MEQALIPQDKSLVKLDYDSWRNCKYGRLGALYRGILQGSLEKNVLENLAEGKDPSYYGCSNFGDKLTFFDKSPDVELYIERQLNNYSSIKGQFHEGTWPFTFQGIVLKLNPEKYKERLYLSRQGEGLIVLGDISLNDLEIIYSKKTTTIIEETIKVHKCFLGEHPSENTINSWKKLYTDLPQKYGFLEEDLFMALQRDPNRIESICDHVFGMRFHPHPEEKKEIIRNGLQILQAKLN
ncbi:hypothetical protein J4465_00310 [Candidatus Pacearchaeota archaeon]|nr:hypothetical protein [Candidatus Pacearchaeota archaeon]